MAAAKRIEQNCTLEATPLIFQQCVTAIICEIDARDGLEAATASAAAAAADRQQLLHMLPLCRVPYLVNSQLPPKDVPHVGMEKGAIVTIDLQLLPSDYKNSMPARSPRFPRGRRAHPVDDQAAGDSSYATYKQQQQKQQQPYFRQAEERSNRSRGGDAQPPTAMLLHSDVRDGPLNALSSTFPLLAHAGRRLSYMLTPPQQHHEVHLQRHQEQQPWLTRTLGTVSGAASGALEALVSNFVGISHRSTPLLLSTLSSSLVSSHPDAISATATARSAAAPADAAGAVKPAVGAHAAAAKAAAAAAEGAADVSGAPIARMARRRDCGRQLHRRSFGCPEWEVSPHASMRQLAKVDDELSLIHI